MKRIHLKQIYKECWKFIKECETHFLIIGTLFLISLAFGFAYPVFFADVIQKFINEIIQKTLGMDFFQLFAFIVWNNLSTAFAGMMFGVLLGIFPLVLSFLNGYVLGFVMNKSFAVGGIGVLWRVLPHGIFEIPALIFSLGTGLRLGTFFLDRKRRGFVYFVKMAFKVFLLFVVPLLLIAGLIEASLMFLIK